MTKCCYCGEEWVREDTELVCKDCEPALQVDLAIADITRSVNELKSLPDSEVNKRIDILYADYQAIGEIIKKLKPKNN